MVHTMNHYDYLVVCSMEHTSVVCSMEHTRPILATFLASLPCAPMQPPGRVWPFHWYKPFLWGPIKLLYTHEWRWGPKCKTTAPAKLVCSMEHTNIWCGAMGGTQLDIKIHIHFRNICEYEYLFDQQNIIFVNMNTSLISKIQIFMNMNTFCWALIQIFMNMNTLHIFTIKIFEYFEVFTTIFTNIMHCTEQRSTAKCVVNWAFCGNFCQQTI